MSQSEAREVARFSVRATGGTANLGQMAVDDLVRVLSAASNISRRSALLIAGRSSPSPDDLGAVQIRILPPRSGSFEIDIALWIIEGLTKGAAETVGGLVATKTFAPALADAITQIYNNLLGQDDPTASGRIEPKLPWFHEIPDASEGLESSFKKLADPIGEGATNIAMIGPQILGRPKTELFNIDIAVKEELEREHISPVVETFTGRVRQLNDRTEKGIVELGAGCPTDLSNITRGIRFWLDDNGSRTSIMERLTANLASNNQRETGPFGKEYVRFFGRRVTSNSGRLKRILIEHAR